MMKEHLCQPQPVLYAEDDENDCLLLRLAFERAAIANPLVLAHDGQEALHYLEGAPGRSPLPCLVVTDLKMPKLNGFDVLSWLQQQPHLRDLPAVVLSSSGQEEDRQRALGLGARAYYLKPFGLPAMVALAKQLQAAWLPPLAGHTGAPAPAGVKHLPRFG